MGPPAPRRASGIVLVLVSGVLFLLLFTSLALLQMARFSGARARAVYSGACARLAAASGMEYAAARLMADPLPRYAASAENRGEDWSFRDGPRAKLEGAANPSYSHGEPWADDGDGLWEPGEADVGGDGRLAARSGRLRGTGAGEAGGPCFVLKIEAPGGKLPVNAGFLDAQDRNGNNIPDCNDRLYFYHGGLVHALNNLGAIVLAENPAIGRVNAPAGTGGAGEPIWVSRLGTDLISNRPESGYRNLEDLDQTLQTLGYGRSEIDAILPFLNVSPREILSEGGKVRYHALAYEGSISEAVPYTPVELATTPAEVLRSLWMYVKSAVNVTDPAPRLPYMPGEPAAWNRTCTRTGPPGTGIRFGESSSQYVVPMIYPHADGPEDEALQLARRAVELRNAGLLSWSRLHKAFVDNAPSLFARDWADLDGFPVAQNAWVRTKADLAFYTVARDPLPPETEFLPAAWSGRLFDFDPAEECQVTPYPFSVSQYESWRVPYPPWSNEWIPYTMENYCNIAPQGLTLMPPSRFLVRSDGTDGPGAGGRPTGASVEEGSLCIGERLEFAAQEDLENLTGGPTLGKAGISVLGAPDRPGFTDVASGRTYPHAVTLPHYNVGRNPDHPFSYHDGTVTLASREGGSQGAQIYLPFSETDVSWNGSALMFGGVPAPYTAAVRSLRDRTSPWALSSYPTQGLDSLHPPWTSAAGENGQPVVDEFSLEAWMTPIYAGISSPPQSKIALLIREGPYAQRYMAVLCKRAIRSAKFYIFLPWPNTYGQWNFFGPVFTADVPDAADPPKTGTYHVVAVFKRDAGTRKTDVTLFVDGEKVGGGVFTPYTPNGEMKAVDDNCSLTFDRIDEFRFHSTALDDARVEELFRLGRYVRSGFYRSPLYDLGGTSRLEKAQACVVPIPQIGTFVRVRGYDGSGFEVPGSPVPLDAQGFPTDLSALGPIRSFRYEVEFVDLFVPSAQEPEPPPLLDAPMFESVWFKFRRAGRAPAWSSWAAR